MANGEIECSSRVFLIRRIVSDDALDTGSVVEFSARTADVQAIKDASERVLLRMGSDEPWVVEFVSMLQSGDESRGTVRVLRPVSRRETLHLGVHELSAAPQRKDTAGPTQAAAARETADSESVADDDVKEADAERRSTVSGAPAPILDEDH